MYKRQAYDEVASRKRSPAALDPWARFLALTNQDLSPVFRRSTGGARDVLVVEAVVERACAATAAGVVSHRPVSYTPLTLPTGALVRI